MSEVNIHELVKEYSAEFNYNASETAIILAAGHGKRIKSSTSKMLHKILEVPTVEKVYNACRKGLKSSNSIVVVGIKAENVTKTIGKKSDTSFAYQEVQHGTGHAVQVALENVDTAKYEGIVYIFAGDMGLLDSETVSDFSSAFKLANSDMMVLTGLYEGDPNENAYGRIIRVKEVDADGNKSEDSGKVIEIKEHKDILALSDDSPYLVEYNGKNYSYSKQELIENNEFNSGVFAFDAQKLAQFLHTIDSNNAQGEIYITDMIDIFNKNGLSVGAVSPKEQYVLMGFNDKAVLTEMNEIARSLVYDKISKIVYIDDPKDFFIADDVIDQIIEADDPKNPLDITIGKGAYIGGGVKLNNGVQILKNATVTGNVELAKNVTIYENAKIDACDGVIKIGENSAVAANALVWGSVELGAENNIGRNCEVKGLTDSCKTGNNVTIDELSIVKDSEIGDNITILYSYIDGDKIENESGEVIVVTESVK
ncbi:MAG: NTP transferase domain-containing protein [Melioribacteraceae bacterium]|nr:NTP transferase domain-containing protein [Melioribacteraceae bacterium]MCF8264483.1 NTP transferase domain-containing protein [Melioribacteraceae bacterium]MCF8411930.1 NTP transferase domain-containing protein [Melioribacteraceae bacterium]MCF8430935.1 NTP transferase domain-containing protein [Melioribacteraceae bacterium]